MRPSTSRGSGRECPTCSYRGISRRKAYASFADQARGWNNSPLSRSPAISLLSFAARCTVESRSSSFFPSFPYSWRACLSGRCRDLPRLFEARRIGSKKCEGMIVFFALDEMEEYPPDQVHVGAVLPYELLDRALVLPDLLAELGMEPLPKVVQHHPGQILGAGHRRHGCERVVPFLIGEPRRRRHAG